MWGVDNGPRAPLESVGVWWRFVGRMKALMLVCRAEGGQGVDESPHTCLESGGSQ